MYHGDYYDSRCEYGRRGHDRSRPVRFRYEPVNAPAVEPVSQTDMELFIKDVEVDEIPLLNDLITTARKEVEAFTNRFLINQEWLAYADTPPEQIFELRGGRIDSVSNIKVFDDSGTPKTVDSNNYFVDNDGARIAAKSGFNWPYPTQIVKGFQVTFVGGYGASRSDVPEPLRNAIKQLVVHHFEYREPIILGSMTKVLDMSMLETLQRYRINNI